MGHDNEPTVIPGLHVRLAASESDIRAAQKLRWDIFHEELGAAACDDGDGDGDGHPGYDIDRYDAFCDHLLVIDAHGGAEEEQVVGTYRLLRESVAQAHGGFYTAGEYDLGAFAGPRQFPGGELLELGRSCVLPAYRNSGTIALLWRGIADYLVQHRVSLMIGCASFPGVDADIHLPALSHLHHLHLAPQELRPTVHPEHRATVELLPIGGYDARLAFRALPPLIKGYLRVGAMIGDGAFIDRRFNTVDVCMVMPVEKIAQRYATRFNIAA